jgi:hypothetical protein
MPSPSELRWSVGKFIYPRGGSTLLHYMPLHDFHLEDALNIAAIVSLRTRRTTGEVLGSAASELSRWMDITAAETIASVAVALLDEMPSESRVVEYDTGLGLVFEVLKLALHQKPIPPSVTYTGISSPGRRLRFGILHGRDAPAAKFSSDSALPLADLVIVNHANGVREPEGPVAAPVDLVPKLKGAAVVVARVTQGDAPQVRTTVTGRPIELPTLSAVLASCRNRGGWHYRYISSHDAGFFLPEEKPETGLLIAYRGRVKTPDLRHFRPVVDEA